MRYFVFSALALLMVVIDCAAEPIRRIRIRGREAVVITGSDIKLGDIAEIASDTLRDDESVIGLKKISIDKSPPAGGRITISASRILERIREEGVNLDQVGYVFPRIIQVQRAGRELSETEVRHVLEQHLLQSRRDLKILKINHTEGKYVPPGDVVMEVTANDGGKQGLLALDLRVRSEEGETQRYNLTAEVEEWIDVPVAARHVGRGSIVEPGDIGMARMNVNSLPRDSARDTRQIIGLEASREIGAGQIFRQNNLLIPPVVEKGSRVILRYRSKLLEASASGIALEDGIIGQEIKIRNDSSNRIVQGSVVEAGLIEITR
jgi:flagella basal body P-ring formation protein FlgA